MLLARVSVFALVVGATSLSYAARAENSKLGRSLTCNNGDDKFAGMLVQPDQKILLSGNGECLTREDGLRQGAVVIRINNDGSLDQDFGEGGIAAFSRQGTVKTMALQADGKVVLSDGGTGRVYRLNTNGAMDETFGQGGFIQPQELSTLVSLQIEPSGKIVVAGTKPFGSEGAIGIAILRFNMDGSIDTSFGNQGMTQVDVNSPSVNVIPNLGQIKITADGSIFIRGYASGTSNRTFYVRLTQSGVLDGALNNTGLLWLPPTTRGGYRRSFDIDNAGRILIGLEYSYVGVQRIGVERRLGNGKSDPTYSQLHSPMPGTVSGGAFTILSDNSTLVAGMSNNSFSVYKQTPDGLVDTAFGIDGYSVASFSSEPYFELPRAIIATSDSKIVLGGFCIMSAGMDSDYCIMRFNASGELDSSFNGNGKWYLEN